MVHHALSARNEGFESADYADYTEGHKTMNQIIEFDFRILFPRNL